MADRGWSVEWTCARCGARNAMPLTRREAAFLDSEPIRRALKRRAPPCASCGAAMSARAQHPGFPTIDDELLEEWFADPKLVFMMQDEDLILAGAPHEAVMRFLDRPDRGEARRSVVGPILALKLHDAMAVPAGASIGGFASDAERANGIAWLRANRPAWERSTRSYVRRRVEPILEDS